MTKQFEFEEYKKLSDVVIDWEGGGSIYRKRSGEWVYLDHDNFCQSVKYAKRVEIKEKTVEAWDEYEKTNESFFKLEKITHREKRLMQKAFYAGQRLTGTIKG